MVLEKIASALARLAGPTLAYADSSSGATGSSGAIGSWTSLSGILANISTFVVIGGSVLMLFGAIGVANAIKDGQGMSMDSNVGKLIGGAFMIAAGAGFKMITTV